MIVVSRFMLFARTVLFVFLQAGSSSDERQSERSGDFDTGGGVAVLYRDRTSSAASRVVSEASKQEAEDVSSLSAFDLPVEALQDKVPA